MHKDKDNNSNLKLKIIDSKEAIGCNDNKQNLDKSNSKGDKTSPNNKNNNDNKTISKQLNKKSSSVVKKDKLQII